MPAKIQLNDPKIISHNNQRKALYRGRAERIFDSENAPASEDLIAAIADMAWRLDAGGVPSLKPLVGRTYMALHNRVTNDAKRINKAICSLHGAVKSSCVPAEMELLEKLAEKGVSPEDVSRVLNALSEVTKEMASGQIVTARQGNTQSPRSAWALAVWPLLSAKGLGMRPAARIIAYVFDESTDNHESVYQAIRNASI